jgi:hypothetical protein
MDRLLLMMMCASVMPEIQTRTEGKMKESGYYFQQGGA